MGLECQDHVLPKTFLLGDVTQQQNSMDSQTLSWLSALSTFALGLTPCHLLDNPGAIFYNYAGRLDFPVPTLTNEPAFFFLPAPSRDFFDNDCSRPSGILSSLMNPTLS